MLNTYSREIFMIASHTQLRAGYNDQYTGYLHTSNLLERLTILLSTVWELSHCCQVRTNIKESDKGITQRTDKVIETPLSLFSEYSMFVAKTFTEVIISYVTNYESEGLSEE